MLELLAFLLILVILFGVAATRTLVFGAFSIIFWVFIAILSAAFLIYTIDALKDKRTPEQKARDKEIEKKKNKEAMESNRKALVFWGKAIVIITVPVAIFTIILFYLIK